MFDSRQTATVLAALRFWQREGSARDTPEMDIATDDGRLTPLSDQEIDALCEGTNCSMSVVESFAIVNAE